MRKWVLIEKEKLRFEIHKLAAETRKPEYLQSEVDGLLYGNEDEKDKTSYQRKDCDRKISHKLTIQDKRFSFWRYLTMA